MRPSQFWNGPLCRNKSGSFLLVNIAAYWKSSNTEAYAKKLSQILANNIDNRRRRIGLRRYVRYSWHIQNPDIFGTLVNSEHWNIQSPDIFRTLVYIEPWHLETEPKELNPLKFINSNFKCALRNSKNLWKSFTF